MGRLIDWIRKVIGGGGHTPVPPPPPGPVPTDVEQIKQRLLALHNEQRAARKLPALTRVVELDRAAQLHNEYMVHRGSLTHDEPGRDIGVRVKAQGYAWSWVGENIAEGQRTAEEVMSSWMGSSGHRANILSGNYKDVGFGVTLAGGTWWWTTDFGKR